MQAPDARRRLLEFHREDGSLDLVKVLRAAILLEIALGVAALVASQALRQRLPEPLRAWLAYEDTRDLAAFDWVLAAFALLILVLTIVSMVGVWRLKEWGRALYTATFAVGFLLVPLLGPNVVHGLAYSIETAATTTGGVILGMLWLSELSNTFTKDADS
jgi:hypothetical protein